MLVSLTDGEVQLLDIRTANLVRRFEGQKQGNFIIRSSFGGAGENFVLSGSEGVFRPPLKIDTLHSEAYF